MTYLNEITLIGRLGKDPEVKSLASGQKVANFSVATSRSWKDKGSDEWKEETQWHNVQAWGPLADSATRLTKGELVLVKGEMRYRKYSGNDGIESTTAEVVATKVGSLTPKPKTDQSAAPSGDYSAYKPAAAKPAANSFDPPAGDDLPF